MTELLSNDHPVVIEYANFMNWLKQNHPEIYSKYSRNFKIPFKPEGGVGVSHEWKISNDEHKMLFKIARSYYHPENISSILFGF